MKHRLIDLLACPICKTFPLNHQAFKETPKTSPVKEYASPVCELYCGLNRKMVKEFDMKELARQCGPCFLREIAEGILTCPACGRWYPIIDEIPHMLPDELRAEREDTQFLERYREAIPHEVLASGKPFNLSTGVSE